MSLKEKIVPYALAATLTFSPVTAYGESCKENLATIIKAPFVVAKAAVETTLDVSGKVINYTIERTGNVAESVLQVPNSMCEGAKKAGPLGLVGKIGEGIRRAGVRAVEATGRALVGAEPLETYDVGVVNKEIEKNKPLAYLLDAAATGGVARAIAHPYEDANAVQGIMAGAAAGQIVTEAATDAIAEGK